ncbi:MAG: hypothetical protein H6622_05700 [Halobacteriovoraceae bacterium]|nr:hypothetical protein [Halobacteriovoraceae bacterium]
MNFVFILLFVILKPLFATYELSYSNLLGHCPFIHTDEFSFNGLAKMIKSQIEVKIEHNENCRAPLLQISNGLELIETLYATKIDPSLRNRIESEVFSNELVNLELSLLKSVESDPDYAYKKGRRDQLNEYLIENKIDRLFQSDYQRNNIKNQLQTNAFQYLAQIFSGISSLPIECIDQLGGWSQLTPIFSHTTAAMAGIAGFGDAGVIGSGFVVLNTLMQIFTNHSGKQALNDLIAQSNSEILACTYFTAKNAACSLRDAYAIAKDTQEIRRIIYKEYDQLPEQVKEYEKYFQALRTKEEADEIFQVIAQMGSSLSLNTDTIKEYLTALKVNPVFLRTTIPILENLESPSESDKLKIQKWLDFLDSQGVTLRKYDMYGSPLPLIEMYKNNIEEIEKGIALIQAMEEKIREQKSFVDLKNKLSSSTQVKKRVRELLTYFSENLEDVFKSMGQKVPLDSSGAIRTALEILEKLHTFLEVQYDLHHDNPQEDYENRVNLKGAELFRAMSRGVVAQLNRQSVFTIGAKVSDRFSWAFKSIEKIFLERDILNKLNPNYVSFSDYKNKKALENQVIQNYELFMGSGKVNRANKYETIMKSFKKTFQTELATMVEDSLKLNSQILFDLDDITAAHYCALFSDFLYKDFKSIVVECRKRFQNLDIISINQEIKLPIKWGDPCFYSDYWKLEKTNRNLFWRELDLRPVSAE